MISDFYLAKIRKKFQKKLIISKNGCCGTCIEHSIAEGIVHIKMTEEAMRYANNNFDLLNVNF